MRTRLEEILIEHCVSSLPDGTAIVELLEASCEELVRLECTPLLAFLAATFGRVNEERPKRA